MNCAWQAYINLLPIWMRQDVDKLGRKTLQELRLRLNLPPELITANGTIWLDGKTTRDDLSFCINAASRYSPWNAHTSTQGYITAPGGHRLGICGRVTMGHDGIKSIVEPTSICIRVARDIPGIAEKASGISGSILVIGCPGSGKTTLLRDLVRQRSNKGCGSVAVVDERGELFPQAQGINCFSMGMRTDILTGSPKQQGIDMVLRTMSPSVIAVDEITAEEDCQSLIRAGWCGVKFLATVHAGNRKDLFSRPIYKPLVTSGLFDHLIILQPDKSWRIERMDQWD